jgi:uncharacterized membrane-anchored protein YhcB (DUF1043 family)
VYSLELLLTIALAATIIGVVIGYFITQRTSPTQQSQKHMENQLQEMQQQQENYQHEVSEHFVETSKLLNQMTDSYREVHKHLAKGAQLLAGDNASQSLKSLSDNSDDDKELLDENLMPPLDYAPKSAPNAPGMLNEEFGLNKKKPEADIDIPRIIEGASKHS